MAEKHGEAWWEKVPERIRKSARSRMDEDSKFRGGYTWEGIVYGLLKLRSPETLAVVEFDAEGEGLAMWSRRRDCLETISRLVTEAKANSSLLSEAIEVAKRDGRME